ncbi:MAG: LytTR family DNA-binding domain-containing protein [Clostridium sp.]
MKIIVNEFEEFEDIEIIINCRVEDDKVSRIIAEIKALDKKIKGIRDGQVFILDIDKIFYFESVDKKTFIYMDKEIYETHLRLYELEEKLESTDFFRGSKSNIVNLAKIKNITHMFGGRLEVLLENNEKLVVSRQYVPKLKSKLNF